MDDNSKTFMQLLQSVKQISDVQPQFTSANNQKEEDRLADLERQKFKIQTILSQLHNSSSAKQDATPTHEIYQNLGPLMGSGLRNAPALPPKQSVADHQPPPLPPRVPKRPLSSASSPAVKLSPGLSLSSIVGNSTEDLILQRLTAEREHLIKLLQDEALVRDKYYRQLESITQKINSIPLPTTPDLYSLDNEAERQKYELEAERIRKEMNARLGTPSQDLRTERLNALQRVEAQINEQRRMESSSRSSLQPQPRSANLEQLYHEAIPMNKALSHSGPSAFGNGLLQHPDESASVISFTSSVHSLNNDPRMSQRLLPSEDVDSLVSLLGCNDIDKMSTTFLAMSSTPTNCDMMRHHRVIPFLVKILHCGDQSKEVRRRVGKALHNIVHAHPEQKQCKREAKILRLLEVLRMYADFLRDVQAFRAEEAGMHLGRKGCGPLRLRSVDGDQTLLCGCPNDESPDGRQVDVPWETLQIPCVHFVNYNGAGEDGFNTAESQHWTEMNIEETMAVLTRCSFDEAHRQPIFNLGGIPALAELIQVERDVHEEMQQSSSEACASLTRSPCTEVRRYAVVALTNLTFGNAHIKSFLCSFSGFVPIMVAQLRSSTSESLLKATAHLFRNLAWKADKSSKQTLAESNVVIVLMHAAMSSNSNNGQNEAKEEPTLKVILSALWNLSAHCRKNKADICSMNGALAFLVALLRHKSPAIVENGGGILRNISSFIATSPEGESYRQILRQNGCLERLLEQLKSSSLTIVSNACGTLWNLSARCPEDQLALWDLGAVPMLQSLTNSKHKTISTCSLAALKNLYAARPSGMLDMVTKGASNGIPSLHARKRRNMVREMSDQLLETPNTPVDDEDSEKSEDNSEIEEEDFQTRQPLVNNFMEEEIEDPPDHPTDYSLQYQESEEAEVNEGNHNELQVKSYFNEGTPFDTPHGISNAGSVTELNKETQNTEDGPLLYATEGTPGCFSRTDSNPEVNDLIGDEEEVIEKGQKEVLEGPSEKIEEKLVEKKTPKVQFMPEDTPMIFSRNSSFESLNSFVQQPVLSGYSSCDYSRATSGRVSPSDLPDSPIQSRPFSPKNGGKLFVAPRPAAKTAFAFPPSQQKAATPESAEILEPVKEIKAETDLVIEENIDEVFELKTYDCEGTPAHGQSQSQSPHNLTLSDDNEKESREEERKEEDKKASESESSDEEAEALITNLQNLAFATSRQGNMKRTTRIPVKSSSGLSSHSGSSRALVFPSTSSNAGDCDEVKKFCAEGTPSWVSKSNSHTNLSTLSIEDLKIEEEDDSESGDDELLQGLVRKAWDANPPKKQPLAAPRHSKVELGQRIGGEGIPTTQANRGLGGITTISCPTPKATGTHQHGKGIACSSVANSSKPRSSPSTEKIPPPPPKRAGSTLTSNLNDEVKIYQVEDTPVHLSEKSSFSDLTVDDPQGSGGRVSVDSNDGLIQHFPNGEDQANQRIGVTPAFRDGAVASNFTRSHSKNDSFGKAERLNVEASKVNVDRPQLSGQSGSSSHKFSDDSDISSSSDEDNDDLLANCIRSGMQSLHKSKSEPLDLKKKLLTKSNSKSSLSRLVPGVRISELKLIKTPPAVETPKEEPPKIIEKSMEDSSLASSICSTLDNIQPPSLMNSLISMSEKPSLPNSPKISSRLECRHSNLSGKKGQKVPEMVRRALDLSSSFSSCQSNLDNIKPPTEMDSSILSIASISSEVADLKSENLTILNDVEPPTLMDEVSGADKTLVPVPDDRTYTIDDGNNELSTCHDITDVFDETLTLGSDNNTDDVIECPELPRDSSRESTPGTKRKQISTNSLIDREKEFSRLRNYKASVPNLDLEDNSLTSGYKSETPRSPKSISRRNSDRFKTQTICKSDLDSDSNSSTSNSPRKTIQQKRREEADRFKTQTIQPSNIIEEEAKNVINIITESKSCARSRSASADGLLDSRILAENELAGSCDSILEQDLLKENINKVGPRICKPTTEEEEEKGIRGRRKGLYSPKKITTQNNAVTKPAPPPKPRNISRTKIPPGSPRGTRSTQLRQFTKTRLNSPPSPKIGQKSKLRAPLASPCPSTISSSSSQSSHSSKLVRQGTFTKDEPSKILVEIDVDDRKPPKRPISSAKKSPNQGGPPVIPQTRTSALRERSRSRQASGSSTTSSNRSIPKPIKTSPSNSSLNNSRLGRRTPTNVEIQRPQQNKAADISDTVSESAVTSGTRKGPKKEVTSKIASLWKKVEDTKKKEKQDKAKDKKVWISKGRVIPESDMAFLRPDEAQKKIINDFQKAQTEKDSPKELKTRSRSRLSIKLSKFKSGNSSNPLKKENSFTYTSHKQSTPMTSTSVPSTPQVENSFDQINGNKRHSRIGTFVAHDEKNSAIVPPFNYSPPNQNEAKNNAVVRRNNSYVSSMGRAEVQKRPKVAKESHNEQDEIDDQGAPTSSVMVTLV